MIKNDYFGNFQLTKYANSRICLILDEKSKIRYLTMEEGFFTASRNTASVNSFPTAAVHITTSEVESKRFIFIKSISKLEVKHEVFLMIT